ncbi:MAG: energy-coupling factor transporter transmembrane component T, partial [Actinomycetota bacterium]
MRNPFNAKAWLAWVVAAGSVVLAVDNPLVTLVALAALGSVAAAFRNTGPDGATYALFLKAGFAFLLVRVILFGLTGHPGDTTLFTLPQVALPRWAGGFALGGRVTGEVVSQQVAEGLKIAAFLACFGVLLSVVETYRIIRLLPRFLFEAGLVVGIALTFVPSLMRSVRDIRDAQRLRGHR